MKTKLLIFIVLFLSARIFSQVGINNTDPKATLDVVATPSDLSKVDGFLAPRLTGDELKAKDALYLAAQNGTIVYVTQAANPTTVKTLNVISSGYYYFNGSQWILLSISQNIGDIKAGFQTSDHSGWIKLDGRLKSSLTSSQQASATLLGLGANLPDATNSYLTQNNTTLGSNSNSNTRIINQNQLPNVQLGGSTDSRQPSIEYKIRNNGAQPATAGSIQFLAGLTSTGSYTAFTTGDIQQSSHSHNVTTNSINGGVLQQSLNVQPQSLSVNMFIYLGQ